MKTLLKTIGAILLIVLALILFVITTPFALVWKIIISITRNKTFNTGISHYFIEIAASFDQLGNAVFGGFFNWLCITKNSEFYKFGDKDETISEVLGWNEHLNSLSKFGKKLAWVLNRMDKNHCKNAMKSGIEKAQRKVEYYKDLKVA